MEGYDHIPPFNCLYNFPYYNDFVQQLGYEKECDWIQYKVVANHGVPEKARRVSKLVKERYKLHFGSIEKLKRDKALVQKFFQVYNDSFASSVDRRRGRQRAALRLRQGQLHPAGRA